MTADLAYLSFVIGFCLIGFAFYIVFSYRGDQEGAGLQLGHKWIVWRLLQACAVLIIVAQGIWQVLQ